ncbi:putative membrane protein [Alkalibacillus flavidus]|uniref:Membrane protein n=1 Tax=Alkalibacillus flavidus TaxID=546021 RepID=A0ABV2KTH9_9BACI
MNTMRMWVNMRDSFWFLPTIYSLLALIAVSCSNIIDTFLIPMIKDVIPSGLFVSSSTASSLYSSLITAILTMITISFSTIMVVLTTYSTQFSPRTLQDFMKSRVTQHVLGFFSFGFIYTLINLLVLGTDGPKGLVGPFSTVLIAIISLGFFILFIHHSSRFLQVNNLIGQIRTDASKLIQNTFREKDYTEATEWDEDEINAWKQNTPHVVKANESGYLQGVEIEGLLQFAKQHKLLLSSVHQVGDYVQKGAPAFYYWKKDGEEADESVEACTRYILVGNERTDVQDIEFSVQKLVEIAVKSISPSINDPHTAVNCINRIGSLLSELASVHQPIRYYADQDGELRFMMEPKKFEDYLYKSFYQIRLYGKKDLTVMDAMLQALYRIAITNEEHIKQDTWAFATYVIESTDIDEMHQLDYERFYETCHKIADVCDEDLSPHLT